jgi:hypothetical protein
MDLAMVKQEQGETLCQYMWCFFDKRGTVVDVTDKEVIDLFQDELYHRRTFEDFGRRRPSSNTKLKDMITSWGDEEDKANTKYDSIRGKNKHNTGGNNNNKGHGVATITTTQVQTASVSQTTQSRLYNDLRRTTRKDLWRLQRLAQREVPVASGGQPRHQAVLPTTASTQRYSSLTTPSRQEGQEESRRRQRRLPRTRQDGECPLRRTTHQTVSEGHLTGSPEH